METGVALNDAMLNTVKPKHKKKQKLDGALHTILDLLTISAWIEDFSQAKLYFDQLKAAGVADFRAYFYAHPEEVMACAGMVKVLAINKAGLDTQGITNISEMPLHLPLHFKEESWPAFCEEMIAMAEGKLTFKQEITLRALSGEDNVVEMNLSVPPVYADTLERVLILFNNLTERKLAESALRKSEERYRALFDSSPIGIALTRECRILYANLACAYMFGYSQPAEQAGMCMSDVVAPESREKFEQRSQNSLQVPPEDEDTRFEITGLRRDGSIFPAALEVTPLVLDDGPALMFFIQDITARKQAEQAEHEHRQLADAMIDIAAALNRSLDYDQILDTILANVGRILPNDTVDITLINDKNGIDIVREKGYADRGSKTVQLTPFCVADIPNLDKMVKTGQPVIVPDVWLDPHWLQFETLDWARSYAGIPIRASGKVIGFINLNSTIPNFYHAGYAERLAAMAEQVSIAFSNASLVRELRQANEQLQAQLTEIQLLQSELREQAIRDPLTGLFNRRHLMDMLHREIERAKRESWPVSVIVIDIDHFKTLNDAHGHNAGDLVLKELGALLMNNTRASDIACRYGGEEFVLVLPNVHPLVAFERAEQIRLKFEWLRIPYEGHELSSTISLGIAVYPLNAATDDEVLIRADRALYQAKQTGRNRTVLYENNPRTGPLNK